jgi:hypothetical protein
MMKRGEAQYVAGTVPVNLAAAAQTGDWVSLKNFNHIEIIIMKAAGGNGEPATFTFEQASDVAGTGAKALNFQELSVKDGADMTAIGAPTLTSPAAGNTYVQSVGDTQSLIVVEFDAQHLDVNNGFDCLRVRAGDVGSTAQWCSVLYRLSEPRGDPQTASAIVD